MYQKLWEAHPDHLEYGNEVFMHSLSTWDIPNVVVSTRKLFNATRNPAWAQRAAWAEWIAVSADSSGSLHLWRCLDVFSIGPCGP
jgi:hypothetical protein